MSELVVNLIDRCSCGFSASPHEHAEFSRHGCYMPTGFFHRFTRDACVLADRVAQGRLVSVLEGGYSNLAIISGVMAHVAGLAEAPSTGVNPEWWDTSALQEVSIVFMLPDNPLTEREAGREGAQASREAQKTDRQDAFLARPRAPYRPGARAATREGRCLAYSSHSAPRSRSQACQRAPRALRGIAHSARETPCRHGWPHGETSTYGRSDNPCFAQDAQPVRVIHPLGTNACT